MLDAADACTSLKRVIFKTHQQRRTSTAGQLKQGKRRSMNEHENYTRILLSGEISTKYLVYPSQNIKEIVEVFDL